MHEDAREKQKPQKQIHIAFAIALYYMMLFDALDGW